MQIVLIVGIYYLLHIFLCRFYGRSILHNTVLVIWIFFIYLLVVLLLAQYEIPPTLNNLLTSQVTGHDAGSDNSPLAGEHLVFVDHLCPECSKGGCHMSYLSCHLSIIYFILNYEFSYINQKIFSYFIDEIERSTLNYFGEKKLNIRLCIVKKWIYIALQNLCFVYPDV